MFLVEKTSFGTNVSWFWRQAALSEMADHMTFGSGVDVLRLMIVQNSFPRNLKNCAKQVNYYKLLPSTKNLRTKHFKKPLTSFFPFPATFSLASPLVSFLHHHVGTWSSDLRSLAPKMRSSDRVGCWKNSGYFCLFGKTVLFSFSSRLKDMLAKYHKTMRVYGIFLDVRGLFLAVKYFPVYMLLEVPPVREKKADFFTSFAVNRADIPI